MKPIELLMEEHRVIERALECLGRMVEEAIAARKLKFIPAENIVDFFSGYADRWHHAKEEDLMFPLAASRGIAWDFDHIADLKQEHVKGRGHVRGMADSFREAAHGSMEEVMNFARHAREYIDLLKGHILKEDRVVFPLIDRALGAEGHRALEASFQKVLEEDRGKNTDRRYRDIVAELALIYNVDAGSDL